MDFDPVNEEQEPDERELLDPGEDVDDLDVEDLEDDDGYGAEDDPLGDDLELR